MKGYDELEKNLDQSDELARARRRVTSGGKGNVAAEEERKENLAKPELTAVEQTMILAEDLYKKAICLGH